MTPLRALAATLLSSAAALAAPVTVTHVGFLVDSSDRPVEGDQSVGFTLWSHVVASDAEYRVWPATGAATCTVAVRAGYFSALLGAGAEGCGSDLEDAHFAPAEVRYLEITVGGVALTPRLRVSALPSASLAGFAEDAGKLGGLARAGYWERSSDLAGATYGATTLGEAIGSGVPALLASANRFAATQTIGTTGDETVIAGGSVTAASFSGSGAGLTGLEGAHLGAASSQTLGDRLDEIEAAVEAGPQNLSGADGVTVNTAEGTTTVGLATDAASLARVSGGLVSASGTVATVAGELAATRMGLGTAPHGNYLLHAKVPAGAGGTGVAIERNEEVVNGGRLHFRRSRGTIETPTALQQGDDVGVVSFNAYHPLSGYKGVDGPAEAVIRATIDGPTAEGDMPTRLQFGTKAPGAASHTTRMVIGSNGRIGVGTNAPLDLLDVTGTMTSSHNIVASSTYTALAVRSWRPTDDYGGLNAHYAKVDFVTRGTTTTGESNDHRIGDLRFSLKNAVDSTAMSDVLTLRSNGNVGVGTTLPTARLQVDIPQPTPLGSAHFSTGVGGGQIVSWLKTSPSASTTYNVFRADVHGAGLIVVKVNGGTGIRFTRIGYLVNSSFTQLGSDANFGGISVTTAVSGSKFYVSYTGGPADNIHVTGYGDFSRSD